MCLLVNSGRVCSCHCASRARESNWRGIILWLVAFLGDGAFIWGLPARSKKQRGAQSSSFHRWQTVATWGAKTDGNVPFSLNPVVDLTHPDWVSGINVVLLLCEKLWAHRFLVQQTSLPAPCWVPPEKERLPSQETGFFHLQKHGTSQTHSQAVLHHEKYEKYFFYRNI